MRVLQDNVWAKLPREFPHGVAPKPPNTALVLILSAPRTKHIEVMTPKHENAASVDLQKVTFQVNHVDQIMLLVAGRVRLASRADDLA